MNSRGEMMVVGMILYHCAMLTSPSCKNKEIIVQDVA